MDAEKAKFVLSTMNWSLLPDHPPCIEGLQNYILHGQPVGHFLTAVLENDLRGAVTRADATNAPCLKGYVWFAHNEMPAMSHGSPELVERWIKAGGLLGMEAD